MPVKFHILPQRNLILFTYSGMVGLQESMDAVSACARSAEYRPWMRQLCDLSLVTGVEKDFPKLLKMQAKFAEDLQDNGHDLIVLFYAPNKAGQELADMARRSWDGLNSVIVMVQTHEAEALALLGLRETRMDELMQVAG